MAEESEGPTDLFGQPWTEQRDPRGRKSHRRTPQVAEMVAVLKATGSTNDEIAARIGLSLPTLKKYYFRELDEGGARARQVLIETMWRKALSGNVAAAKFVRDLFPKGDAAAFLEATQRNEPGPSSPARVGKKEAAQLAAQTAGQDSEWGDDLIGPTLN